MKTNKRKGAKNIKNVPDEVKNLLNQGKISSNNLVESLAIDYRELLKNVLNDLSRDDYLDECIIAINKLEKQTIPKSIKTTGEILLNESIKHNDDTLLKDIENHPSDTVRSWGPYIIGFDNNLNIGEKLDLIKVYAADDHYGVREIAWMGLRENIIDNLDEAIEILSEWTNDSDCNIRRFASESTRPRGVWAKHITELKNNPDKALPILENLKADESKYVQDSVGNWLNDASKSQPNWVIEITEKWSESSKRKETQKIIKRGLRTINK